MLKVKLKIKFEVGNFMTGIFYSILPYESFRSYISDYWGIYNDLHFACVYLPNSSDVKQGQFQSWVKLVRFQSLPSPRLVA